MKDEAAAIPVWTYKTAGLASSAQVTSGTGVVEAFPTDVSTMPLVRPVPWIDRPSFVPTREFETIRKLSTAETELQKGLLSLLSFNPEPDQPADEDVGPRPTHHLPW